MRYHIPLPAAITQLRGTSLQWCHCHAGMHNGLHQVAVAGAALLPHTRCAWPLAAVFLPVVRCMCCAALLLPGS
jgi:hypothetical protein